MTHPENPSYPLFSACLSKAITHIDIRESRTELEFIMGNLQLFDNMQFPETLDPTHTYPADSELHSFEIFGLNDQK
jgi:hypothetical protein